MLTKKQREKLLKQLNRKPQVARNWYDEIPEAADKQECYSHYEGKIFGNKALTWNSCEEIIKSGYNGKVCMRSRKGIDRKKVVYNLSLEDVPKEILKWKKESVPENMISFNQSMPDEALLLQGEVMRNESGLYLRYTTIKKPMNIALEKEDLTAKKLKAKFLLESNLCYSSYSDLEALLDLFPESVIEFSSYSVNVGNIPARNTVIWEVRNY